MRTAIVIALALTVMPGAAPDEVAPSLAVGANRRLSTDAAVPYTEPHVAVSAGNPRHMVVASIRGFSRARGEVASDCALLTSVDAGRTWREAAAGVERCADPWVAAGRDGGAAAVVLRDGGELLVLEQDAGHAAWRTRESLGRGFDHPTIAAHPSTGAVAMGTTRSMRGPGGRGVGAAVAIRGAGGAAAWLGFAATAGISNATNAVWIDDGRLLVAGIEFASRSRGRQELHARPRVWSASADARGGGLNAPVAAAGGCDTGVGFPVLAANPASRVRSRRAFLACVGGGGQSLGVRWTDDAGVTWSAPVVVAGAGARVWQGMAVTRRAEVPFRTPGAAVNRDGMLVVTWQERVAGTGRGPCHVLMAAASADGGETFSRPVRAADRPSCPDVPLDDAASQWPAGTDYGAIADSPDGSFVAVWADARTGRYQLSLSTLRIAR